MVTASSCDEWLSATSSMEIPSDKLFSTRGGFQDALSGIYIAMGEDDAYGKYYTWFANDLAAYPYVAISELAPAAWQTHNYTHKTVKSEIASMWLKGYNIIAGINKILSELEVRCDVITSDVEYRLMKGELLALRAYIHFDLMRMFGIPDWTGENAFKLTIPYVTVYSKEPVQQKSYAATAELLMWDIESALELLEDVDPVKGVVSDDFATTINDNGFWNNRTTHLNYYAVKALAARVYQWNNDTETAARYAGEVIDEVFANDVVSWVDAEEILLSVSNDSKDWSFSCEHIFSLQISELYSKVYQIVLGNAPLYALYVYENLVSGILFPILQNGLTSGAEDIRGTALHLKYSGGGYLCYKLYGSSSYKAAYRNRMPMIKISEMYYMVAENHIARGENAEAIAALDQVRKNRGIKDELPADTDPMDELMKEYYREFISEGQLFYWLKHKGVNSSLSNEFSVKASDLVYPYPEDEINYGRKQEL